ncbi:MULTISPECIES: hypothetical protein [unclassified Mameliella]|uniref:hypothetical protein n=1 Tax=unclassified Mameliella TaxID=2630630 RepID=UPI00273F698A|nr:MULTISPECIES: hypothetical protein [unclassified Mameliella]
MSKASYPIRGLAAVGLGACMMIGQEAAADQVFVDDVIIQGSLCVGVDCVNGESFGFDTIRLKENNLRIKFLDTSSSASFPTVDWQIVANDSSNGGLNYLAFQDDSTGRIPFRVEASAPANSLYVESDGDLGIKTSQPAVDIHVVEGNTPTLRLEQDGSDGFAPQVYDIAANEANFFIRDVTNGSRLFFRAKPGAPEDSLYIDSTGEIGIGTDAPTESLHVRRTDGTATLYVQEVNATAALRNLIKLDNNGEVGLRMQNTATSDKWALATAGGNFIVNGNGGPSEFTLAANGDLTIAGTLITSGSCSVGCDAVFGPDYDILPISDRAAMMYDLGYLPNVGPTAEAGQYDLTKKVLGMLNELEHAHIYISQLNQRIEVLEEALATQAD